MQLTNPTAELFVPDNCAPEAALARTTDLAVAAHQDDLEIIAAHCILECYRDPNRWFCGIVVGDGAGSPRGGTYAACSDAEMRRLRRHEQQAAAMIGEYGALLLLDYPSSAIKESAQPQLTAELVEVLRAARPRRLVTHALSDKHDTHVAVALRTIAAARQLPADLQLDSFCGAEVWRDLDWLVDEDKLVFDLSARESLQAALLGVFDSQITGGKRYDLAVLGRRRAHASFHRSHATDAATMVGFAMDFTPLLEHPELDPSTFAAAAIKRFADDVDERIRRLAPVAANDT